MAKLHFFFLPLRPHKQWWMPEPFCVFRSSGYDPASALRRVALVPVPHLLAGVD